jgi:hypothetical protein
MKNALMFILVLPFLSLLNPAYGQDSGNFEKLIEFFKKSPQYMKDFPECFKQLESLLDTLNLKKDLILGDLQPEKLFFKSLPGGGLDCHISGLDSVRHHRPDDLPLSPNIYYPSVLRVKGEMDKKKYDRFSLSISLLNVIWQTSNEFDKGGAWVKPFKPYEETNQALVRALSRTGKPMDLIQDEGGRLDDGRGNYDPEEVSFFHGRLDSLAKEMKDKIDKKQGECQKRFDQICPLFDRKIMDYIQENFFNYHPKAL